MRIERVQSTDAGAYSCHASNGIGDELVAHFSLFVKGIFHCGPGWAKHLFYPPLGPLCVKQNEALFSSRVERVHFESIFDDEQAACDFNSLLFGAQPDFLL